MAKISEERADVFRTLMAEIERNLADAEAAIQQLPPDLPGRNEVLADCAGARLNGAKMRELVRRLTD